MFLRKTLIAIVWNGAIFGTALFWGGGTWHWWRAWVFLSVVVVGTAILMVTVFRDRQDLLNERFKGLIQKGQPWIDRLVVVPFALSYGLLIALTPIDARRWHLLGQPGLFVSSLGLVLVVAGWAIIGLSLKANNFAIPVVKLQTERQHFVVDSGIYAVIRHPMYTGVILFMFGMPLWLESYAGALFAFVPTAALAIRILIEERFLRSHLVGYGAYTERVRYRLIPYVW